MVIVLHVLLGLPTMCGVARRFLWLGAASVIVYLQAHPLSASLRVLCGV
jgi:hypothetical protein